MQERGYFADHFIAVDQIKVMFNEQGYIVDDIICTDINQLLLKYKQVSPPLFIVMKIVFFLPYKDMHNSEFLYAPRKSTR